MQGSELTKSNTLELEEFKVPAGIVNLNEISQMLIEQMKDVKNNPAAIPQAECAVMIAGRIVDIARTQVQQANMVSDLIRLKKGI